MKFIVFLIIFLLFYTLAKCEYTQTCKVKYKSQNDWSEYYKVEVHFLSGFELNQKTKTFDYESATLYAVIFWKKDQSSVIKITSTNICGMEATQGCITMLVTNIEGVDSEKREWEVCTTRTCF